jgi:hypothetical protein
MAELFHYRVKTHRYKKELLLIPYFLIPYFDPILKWFRKLLNLNSVLNGCMVVFGTGLKCVGY